MGRELDPSARVLKRYPQMFGGAGLRVVYSPE